MQDVKKPHYVLLIGKPAVGKSTLAQQYAEQGYTIFSGDKVIEKLQEKYSLRSYDAVVTLHPKEVTSGIREEREQLLASGKSLVFDFFNLTQEARAIHLDAMAQSGHDYTVDAVMIYPPPADQYNERLRCREEQGKSYGITQAQQIILDRNFEPPSYLEGFNHIEVRGEAQYVGCGL